MNKIDTFSGTFRFLSNFYPVMLGIDGYFYPTLEHAYQAAKTTNKSEQKLIRQAKNAGEAKRLGGPDGVITLRPDWEEVKLEIMEYLLRKKFQHPDLTRKLLNTGNTTLIEGNFYHDIYYGVCRCKTHNGQGENWLGKLLQKIRTDLANSEVS